VGAHLHFREQFLLTLAVAVARSWTLATDTRTNNPTLLYAYIEARFETEGAASRSLDAIGRGELAGGRCILSIGLRV
jgi:hypothetical protein